MKRVDFEHGSIASSMIQTALPLLAAQLVNLLYNIVDRIYIGRIPGIGLAALGATGICFPIIVLVSAFASMFGTGGAPLFAMEFGRGNHEKATVIINTSYRLLFFSGLILMIGGEVFSVPLLHLFGATDSAMVYARPYLQIYLVGTVFALYASGLNPFINAQGYPSIGMVSVLCGALANLILDPLFIFAFGMGVPGAAVATVLSQILSAFIVWRFLNGKRNTYRISLKKDGSKGYFEEWQKISALGLAPFIMQCTNSLVQAVANSVLVTMGSEFYVSIMTIISSVRQILDTPIMAIAEGASPILSYNYGANHPDRIKKAIILMTCAAAVYTLLIWGCIMWFPGFFINIFNNEADLQAPAIHMLNIYFFAFVFQALQYSGQTVFKALNRKNQAIFFSLFRKVIIVIPLTLWLPHTALGLDGVFWAEPVSNVIGGICCFATMLVTVHGILKTMKAAG